MEKGYSTGGCGADAAAFFLAYTIHYTNLPGIWKKVIRLAAVAPMLLPTITYGFAIIYSFGKQGLLTRILGFQLFDIYGFWGLLLGYVIYTLPVSFLLILNTMSFIVLTRILGFQLFDIYGFWGLLLGYVIYTLPVSFLLILNTMSFIDKKFMIVSRIMGDHALVTFLETIIRPLLGTLAASFVQCFFLCFTDYGIPASVGGQYEVVATVLYNEMLGSVPNFNRGAVVAMMMMVPSVLSITLLHYLEKYNIRYSRVSQVELKKNPVRDVCCGAVSFGILLCVLSSFAVIVIVPAVEEWPYQLSFTWKHVSAVLGDSSLLTVYKNFLLTAGLTALVGSLVVYGAALVTARSSFGERKKAVIESIALVTNTIPGMVIGIAFLFAFSGTPLQNTFFLIVICNVVHFFSTPYLIRREAMPFIRER